MTPTPAWLTPVEPIISWRVLTGASTRWPWKTRTVSPARTVVGMGLTGMTLISLTTSITAGIATIKHLLFYCESCSSDCDQENSVMVRNRRGHEETVCEGCADADYFRCHPATITSTTTTESPLTMEKRIAKTVLPSMSGRASSVESSATTLRTLMPTDTAPIATSRTIIEEAV